MRDYRLLAIGKPISAHSSSPTTPLIEVLATEEDLGDIIPMMRMVREGFSPHSTTPWVFTFTILPKTTRH